MMQPHRFQLHFLRFCLSLAVAMVFILVNGYSFNGGDQEEHLPYVYRLLNPVLYPADYLVPLQTEHFTVRYYYAHLIAMLGEVAPVRHVVFMVYLACLVMFTVATGTLSAQISRSSSAFVMAPFLVLIFFNRWTIGGNALMDDQLTCTVPAMALASLAFLMAYRRKYLQMAIFSGLAALFQVLIGMQVFIILFIACIGINGTSFPKKYILQTLIVFLLVSSPMVVPIVYRHLHTPAESADLYHFILFRFRNAHHYYPSVFPLIDYIKTITLVVIAGSIFLLGFFRDFKKFFNWIALIIISFSLMYFLIFELAGVAAAGKTQWFKSTVWLTWSGAIAIAARMSSLKTFSKFDMLLMKKGFAISLFVIVVSSAFMLSGNVLSAKIPARYQLSATPITDQQKMHQWISKNTPLSCIVIIPPDNDRFLCEAQRSTPVAWKGIIHESWFLLNWYRDFKSVYGNNMTTTGLPQSLSLQYRNRPDSLINPSRTADYRLLDLSLPGPAVDSARIIHQEGNLVLLHFEYDALGDKSTLDRGGRSPFP